MITQTVKLTKEQQSAIQRVYEDFELTGIGHRTRVALNGSLIRQLVETAVVYAVEGERERLADKVARIIGGWPYGLQDLEALEYRLRRCEP